MKQGSVLHSHQLPAAVNRSGEKKVSCRSRMFVFVKYNFLFYLYHQCCHQLMETTDPCYLQKWFSVYFFLFQTSRKKQSQVHGQCPVGSDLFSSRGMAEQCKDDLNHPRAASSSRGFVLPMPATGCSADLGVTAWKTLLSRSSCSSEINQTYPGKYT